MSAALASMNSSNRSLLREVSHKEDGFTTGIQHSYRRFLTEMLLTLFKYLAIGSWLRRFSGFRFKCIKQSQSLSLEKVEFLEKYGNDYGFPDGAVSVDELRSKEFARLEGTIYLDHAGATLYTDSQLKAIVTDLSTHLYGNPHSQSESSSWSSNVVEHARSQVLAMCKVSAEQYSCVFTSGATASLKLVGETFPWSSDSQYMYTMENHNSVLGIREYALSQGATVTPVDIDYDRVRMGGGAGVSKFCSDLVRPRSTQIRNPEVARNENYSADEPVYNLFACPLECNFSGAKIDLALIASVQQGQHVDTQSGQWLVLLDAAKGCSTAPPDLSRFPVDFVALSFYKIFGYPTGLGALLVRKDAGKLLKKKYFGGGTVAVSIADADFVQRRQRLEQWLEDGTVSFLAIAALRHGFSVINQLQMSAIGRHTGCLASYTAFQLASLKHSNGRKLCVLYGNHQIHKKVQYWGPNCEQGPIVTFNMKRADGSWIGSREVEKLAMLSGIHLRTGCFCNPGACGKYLGLSTIEMKANFEAGHVCWDDNDLINGCPTGAVRVSFGYMNTFEDCSALLRFITKYFLEQNLLVNSSQRERNEGDLRICPQASKTSPSRTAITGEPGIWLQSITVYPIKSCAGFTINAWPLGDWGLLYDREWLILSSSGEVLTQKKCPLMFFLQTYIDLESGILHVQAPNMRAILDIPIIDEVTECKLPGEFVLCGGLFGANTTAAHAADWFTEALGISCRLVRKESKNPLLEKQAPRGAEDEKVRQQVDKARQQSFANEGQFLLVSQQSVEDLNIRLLSFSSKPDGKDPTSASRQSKFQVDAFRFRPNLVVSGSRPYDEDDWEALTIGDQDFKVLGGCNRCKMINFDQSIGDCQTASEPLITLASYRRVKGRIFFGILLEQDPASLHSFPEETSSGAEQELENERIQDGLSRRYNTVLRVGQRLIVSKRTIT